MGQHAPRRKTRNRGIPLTLASAEELLQIMQDIHNLIAQRAYQIFEHRGSQQGHDVFDWLQAELEILHSGRHEIQELPESLLLRAELPGRFTADRIKVSVEPRRVMVTAKELMTVTCCDGSVTETRPRLRQLFRVHDLSASVDSSRSKAELNGNTLQIVMPKLAVRDEGAEQAQ